VIQTGNDELTIVCPLQPPRHTDYRELRVVGSSPEYSVLDLTYEMISTVAVQDLIASHGASTATKNARLDRLR